MAEAHFEAIKVEDVGVVSTSHGPLCLPSSVIAHASAWLCWSTHNANACLASALLQPRTCLSRHDSTNWTWRIWHILAVPAACMCSMHKSKTRRVNIRRPGNLVCRSVHSSAGPPGKLCGGRIIGVCWP